MGRVEIRRYKRAQSRKRAIRCAAVVVLLALAATAALRQGQGRLQAHPVAEPTPTPVTRAYDQRVDTREIVLEEQTWYAIQTGVYSAAEAAEEKRNLYAGRGAPGYVNQDGQRWRVYIACYGDKTDAAAVRERLSESQQVETYLHSWVCPALTLRLTGMVGQMDVAEAGLTLMLNTAAALRDNAALLDGGEITLGETMDVIAALDEQVQLWRSTAQERFSAPVPELIGALLAESSGWSTCVKSLQAAKGATALSGEMKVQAMSLYDRCCETRAALLE